MRNGQPVAVLLDFDDYRGLVAAQALGRDSERATAIRSIANRFGEGHMEGFREVPDAPTIAADPPSAIITPDEIAAGRRAYDRARDFMAREIGHQQRRAADFVARHAEKTRADET